MVAGIIATLGAFLCCITPVLAITAGIAGAASAFSWLDPFGPYLIALTVLVLGFAWWYQKLKSKKQALTCACEDEDKKPFLQTKKFLGLITVLALLLLVFPYYSSIFSSEPEKGTAMAAPSMLREAKLDIQGMPAVAVRTVSTMPLTTKKG